MVDETEREFRAIVGRRFKLTRIALGYKNRSDLARLFVSKPDEIKSLADRIRQWEDGKALVPPYFLRQLRMRHGITHDWIFEGDPSRLPHDLADLVLRPTG